jgi:hypothetical protein
MGLGRLCVGDVDDDGGDAILEPNIGQEKRNTLSMFPVIRVFSVRFSYTMSIATHNDRRITKRKEQER